MKNTLPTEPRTELYVSPAPNPGTHLLYVERACEHLTTIERHIKELGDFSNVNTAFLASRLREARDELIAKNPAYKDAARILKGVHRARRRYKRRTS